MNAKVVETLVSAVRNLLLVLYSATTANKARSKDLQNWYQVKNRLTDNHKNYHQLSVTDTEAMNRSRTAK